MTRYDVNITRKALKELNKLDPHSRNRILEALIILRDYGFTRQNETCTLLTFFI